MYGMELLHWIPGWDGITRGRVISFADIVFEVRIGLLKQDGWRYIVAD